jgi:malate:Na+ symporter
MKDNPVQTSPAPSSRFAFGLNNTDVVLSAVAVCGHCPLWRLPPGQGYCQKYDWRTGGDHDPRFCVCQNGRQIPVLKDIGGPAILCLMVPSVLVYFGVFEKHTLDTVHLLMKEANCSISSSPVWWWGAFWG